jgi:hypothetical protein
MLLARGDVRQCWFLWEDGVCGLDIFDRHELAVELNRVEDVQVVLLRLVLIDVERPLLASGAVDVRSSRSEIDQGPVEDEKDREIDIRGGGVVRRG